MAVPKGDPRFHALLAEIGELHDKKQADYGRTKDPFANVRSASEFGVQPWVGAMVRANDKVTRLKLAASGEALTNESVEDSLMDLAVYALISLILYREGRGEIAAEDPNEPPLVYHYYPQNDPPHNYPVPPRGNGIFQHTDALECRNGTCDCAARA